MFKLENPQTNNYENITITDLYNCKIILDILYVQYSYKVKQQDFSFQRPSVTQLYYRVFWKSFMYCQIKKK